MTLHDYSMAGTSGSAWNSDWATGHGTLGTVDLQGGAGRLFTGAEAFGEAWAVHKLNIADPLVGWTNVLFDHDPQRSSLFRTFLRSDDNSAAVDGPANGWALSVSPLDTSNNVTIKKITAGSPATWGFASLTLANNTPYDIWCEAIGTVIQMRVFPTGGTDPGWTPGPGVVVVTGAVATSGYTRVLYVGGSDTAARQVLIGNASIDDRAAAGTGVAATGGSTSGDVGSALAKVRAIVTPPPPPNTPPTRSPLRTIDISMAGVQVLATRIKGG